jgi:hypothetical protein
VFNGRIGKRPDGEALWTSNPFKGTISALATADVDGDGRPDIVFAHENQIVARTPGWRSPGIGIGRL